MGVGIGAIVWIGAKAGIGVVVGWTRTTTTGVAVGVGGSDVSLPHEAKIAMNTIEAARMYALFISVNILGHTGCGDVLVIVVVGRR